MRFLFAIAVYTEEFSNDKFLEVVALCSLGLKLYSLH